MSETYQANTSSEVGHLCHVDMLDSADQHKYRQENLVPISSRVLCKNELLEPFDHLFHLTLHVMYHQSVKLVVNDAWYRGLSMDTEFWIVHWSDAQNLRVGQNWLLHSNVNASLDLRCDANRRVLDILRLEDR